jgi:putative nucleotidyltransferase with HDIG domain
MPGSRRLWRYLPHAVVATFAVMVLPAIAVWALAPSGSAVLLLASIPLAMGLSVAVAAAGAAVWKRRPGSQDVVFADLMLWGWLRRLRAERRLAEARTLVGAGAEGMSPDRRVEALTRLSALLEARDAYTHGHTRRVTRHAERIARAMRLAPEEVARVRTAAALHDVGKLNTPREVLNKPGRLTDEEFAVIKRHPVEGADMLAGFGDPEVTAMVRHHHERLDGRGYPDGLAGEEIPLGARIIAVADTFDAMTSSRSYRRACPHKKALDVIAKEAGAQLDGAAVTAFLGYYSGRRSVAWSSLITTVPQRALAWLGGGAQGVGAGVAATVQALPILGAAALVAAGPGSAEAARHQVRDGRTATASTKTADRLSASAHASTRRPRAAHKEVASGVAVPRRGTARRPGRARHTPTAGVHLRAGAPGGHHGSTPSAPSGGGGAGGQSPSSPQPHRSPSGGGTPSRPTSGSTGGGSQTPTPGSGSTPAPSSSPTAHVPAVHVPGVQVPSVQTPQVDLPGGVSVPQVSTPEIHTPEVNTPDVNLPGVHVPAVHLP